MQEKVRSNSVQAEIYTTGNDVTVVDFQAPLDKKNLCHDVVISVDSINGVLTVKATRSGWVEVDYGFSGMGGGVFYDKDFQKKVREEDFETIKIPWYGRSIGELLKGTGKTITRPKEGWIRIKDEYQRTFNIQTTMYFLKHDTTGITTFRRQIQPEL